MSAPLRLLCVFAHPDDEGFGTGGMLIKCIRRGVQVHVLSATPGDAGKIAVPSLATPETLGAVRRRELARACEILGTQPPEVLDYADGRLAEADPDQVVRDIVQRMRVLRPDIVLTFDANGGYGHADHMAIHHRTVAAFEAAADPNRFPELGLEPHRPAKLYFTAYPRSLMRQMKQDMKRHNTAIDFSDVQEIEDHEVGTEEARITTVVDVRDVFDQRWASLRAHETQVGPDNPFYIVPEEILRDWMAFDNFVRAWPKPERDGVVERDVLDGLL